MPHLKVSVQGRKYAISGLSGRTNSKDILCSLARVHSMLSLVDSDTTLADTQGRNAELQSPTVSSDTSFTEKQERKRERRKLRRSESNLSESSRKNRELRLESQERNAKGLRRRDRRSWPLSFDEAPEYNTFMDLCKMSQNVKEHRQLSSSSSSDVYKWKNRVRRSLSKSCALDEKSTKEGGGKLQSEHSRDKKPGKSRNSENKERKRHKERRTDTAQMERMRGIETTDPRGNYIHRHQKSSCEKMSSRERETKHRKERERHERKKHRKRKNELSERDLTYTRKICYATDSSETDYNSKTYGMIERSCPKTRADSLKEKDVERIVSKVITRRLPQLRGEMKEFEKSFHVSAGCEKETRGKLLKLAASQRKCLLAFDKCIKSKDSSIARYSKWCQLREGDLQVTLDAKVDQTDDINERKEPSDKCSETDHDTGISEMHSDGSIDVRSPSGSDIITGNDITKVMVTSHEVVASKVTRLPSNYKLDDGSHDKAEYFVISSDVADEVIHSENEKDEAHFDKLSVLSNVGSAGSVTIGMLSDISDTNSVSSRCESSDRTHIQLPPEEKFQLEKNRHSELKESIHRVYRDLHLTESRIHEQNKLVALLSQLKKLNEEVLESQKVEESVDNQDNLKEDEERLRTSIELSSKLYEYQKSEIRQNAEKLRMLESRIRRKRWHVDSVVRELERFITSPLQPRPRSSPELHPEFRSGSAYGVVLGSFV